MKFLGKNNRDNSPERGMVPLREMMNRLFDESFLFPGFTDSRFLDSFLSGESEPFVGVKNVKIDVEESEKEFVVTAELPGVDPDKVDLDLNENRLTISAKIDNNKEEKGKNYIRRECSCGKIQRTLDLSDSSIETEKASANFKNGVLKIVLPKKDDTKSKGKKIPINS